MTLGCDTILSTEMRRAADVIDELNRRYDFGERMPWDPESLRREADVVRSEEREMQGPSA